MAELFISFHAECSWSCDENCGLFQDQLYAMLMGWA